MHSIKEKSKVFFLGDVIYVSKKAETLGNLEKLNLVKIELNIILLLR